MSRIEVTLAYGCFGKMMYDSVVCKMIMLMIKYIMELG